ncbi:MAG: HAD-IIB family hydrolase [Selenomonadaceae bacterium]|nr:HAD-IIB family hydrolase [Selenomonadaceae bacterium]
MEIRNEALGIRNENSCPLSPIPNPLKIAASDFDGTLFREQKFSSEDLATIRAWRAAGNKFGLVTGRCYPMLIPHLQDVDLAIDFAICDNGAIIFDGAVKIIFETEIPKEILLALFNEPFLEKSLHFLFEAADEVYCVNVKENSWVIREQPRWEFFLTPTDAAQVKTLPKKINQFALGFTSSEEAQEAADFLNKNFGDVIFAQKNTRSLDVVTAGINKASGVEKLLEVCNWDGKVYVIGDESNDLPMIKKFGGYTVSTAKDFVKQEATEIFDSVGAMLKNFLDKN